MPLLRRDDGVALHYEIHGTGPEDDAPPVLLTHGYGLTARMWAGQTAAISRDRRLLVWDLRGHGRSDSPGDGNLYGSEACVADMAALLDLHGIGRAVVGGLSLGGYLSLAFHLRFPERVTALMLFDCGPGFRRDGAREAWNARALSRADRLERGGFEALPGIEAGGHRDPGGLAHAARGMLTQGDGAVMDSLRDIGVPTLVLVGADDEPFRAAADHMTAKIPNAVRVVLPDAGHTANIDNPVGFNAAVTAFLSGIRGS